VRDTTYENLLLAISQLERIDLFIYGMGGKKTKTFSKCIQPARIGRKDREFVGKNGEKESIDRESVPISGQSPANFGACQIHPCSAAVRGLHPSAITLLLALDRRNRCCAGSRDFAPSLSVSHLSARVQNPAHSHSLSLTPYATLVRSINPRSAIEGLCTRTRRKTAGDDCGLWPRKTIVVG